MVCVCLLYNIHQENRVRIGINVPNELLQRVRKITPEVNVSQVCRDALERRASVAERAAAQAVSDGVDYQVDRLYQSIPKPLPKPDWEALAYEDARGWIRNFKPERLQWFIETLDFLRENGRDVLDMVPHWSMGSVYAEGVKGFYHRREENTEWFIEQYEIEEMSGINLHQSVMEEYSRAWLSYVNEVVRLLEERRKDEYERQMAEREERRQPLPKPELPPRIEDVQQAIQNLTSVDYTRLRSWFNELDSEEWDRQIEADSADGKLDSLIVEAEEAKQQGTLKAL